METIGFTGCVGRALTLYGVNLLHHLRKSVYGLLDRVPIKPAIVGAHLGKELLPHNFIERHRENALDQFWKPRPRFVPLHLLLFPHHYRFMVSGKTPGDRNSSFRWRCGGAPRSAFHALLFGRDPG